MNIFDLISQTRKAAYKENRNNLYCKKESAGSQGGTGAKRDDIIAKLKPFIVENGLVIQPYEMSEPLVENLTTKSGAQRCRITQNVTFLVAGAGVDEEPKTTKMTVVAQGLDSGDKGPGKLVTYAEKQCYKTLFNIETGENEESREELEDMKRGQQEEQTLASNAQINTIRTMLSNLGREEEGFLTYLNDGFKDGSIDLVNYELNTLEDLSVAGAKRIESLLVSIGKKQDQKNAG